MQVLPKGVPVIGAPLAEHFGGGAKGPRSYAELDADGLLALLSDPWRYFDRRELDVAWWMLAHGILVRSVGVDDRPTPDAVIDAARVTVEFKSVAPGSANPAGAAYQRLRHARNQAQHVVIDVRGTGCTRGDANRAVVRALRNGGRDLREVTVVGDDFVLSWP